MVPRICKSVLNKNITKAGQWTLKVMVMKKQKNTPVTIVGYTLKRT